MQVRILFAEPKKAEVLGSASAFFVFVLPNHNSMMPMSAEEAAEPCYLYILHSVCGDRYYTGISSDPERRLVFHNSRERGFTSRYRPWKLVFMRQYASRSSARKAEITVKSWKSRVMIENFISGTVEL